MTLPAVLPGVPPVIVSGENTAEASRQASRALAAAAIAEDARDVAQEIVDTINFEFQPDRFIFGRPVAFGRVSVAYGLGDAITTDGTHYAKYSIRGVGGTTFTRAADGFWEIDARGLTFAALTFADNSVIDAASVRYHDGKEVVRAWTGPSGSQASLIERADGSVYIPKLVAPGFNAQSAAYQQDGIFYPTRYLVPVGDSMTAAGYADTVSATVGVPLLTPSNVSNDGTNGTAGGGIGSQAADQIAARFGALPLKVRVNGDTLVAGANTLSSISVALLSRFADNSGGIRTLRATIQTKAGAMIAGTLRSALTAGGEIVFGGQEYRYTFTPDAGQVLGAVPADARLRIDAEGRDRAVQLVWVGRNNVSQAGWQDEVKKRIASIVTAMRPAVKRFVVIGVTNQRSEPSGTTAYNEIVALNADLAALYPANFLDVRPFYNAGEATDIPLAANTDDGLHYNATGKAVIAAAVSGFLTAKGWF